MRTLLSICLAGLAILNGQTQTIYEPFDYTPDSGLIGQTHPSGFTWLAAGSGPEQPDLQTGHLPVPGLAAPAGQRVRIRPGSGPSARLPFDNAATNGTGFFSLALRAPSLSGLGADGDFFAGFTPAAGAQTTTPSNVFTRVLLRAAPGGYQFGLAKSAAQPVWSPTPFGSNDTVFLVGSYTFNGGPGNDLARLWINPDAATLGAADPPSPTLSSLQGQDASQLASWLLCQRPAPALPALLQVDELRIGPTWASVTPPAVQNVNDLRVRLLSATAQPTVGHSFRFVAAVDNRGSVTVQSAGCIISVPANLPFSLLRANSSHGSNQVEGSRVTWNLGQLSPQQAATIDITLTPALEGNYTLQATLNPPSGDANPQNDTAPLSVSIRPGLNGPSVSPQPVLLSISRDSADQIRLGYRSQSNVLHRLDRTSDLRSGRWETVTEHHGNGSWRDAPIQLEQNLPGFFKVVSKSPRPWLGSWSQYIKTNSVDWHDDVLSLEQALQETGQNFCIYPIDEDLDWLDFTNLLQAVKGGGKSNSNRERRCPLGV